MAAKNLKYHDQVNVNNTLRLRQIINSLPVFCKDFFLGIKDTTQVRTRLAYAYDLRIFFEYLHEMNPVCAKYQIRDIPIDKIGRAHV